MPKGRESEYFNWPTTDARKSSSTTKMQAGSDRAAKYKKAYPKKENALEGIKKTSRKMSEDKREARFKKAASEAVTKRAAELAKKDKAKTKAKKDRWYPGKNVKNLVSKVKSKLKRKPKKAKLKGPGVVSKAKTKVATTLSKTQKTVKTKGGDYKVYKKKSMAGKNFRSEFSKARKAGKKAFTWDGRSYSTARADDKPKKASSGVKGPKAKPTKQAGGKAWQKAKSGPTKAKKPITTREALLSKRVQKPKLAPRKPTKRATPLRRAKGKRS